MKTFLENLVKYIVDKPESVSVTETSQQGQSVFELSVDPSDMGKIIGKGGRIIKAIRDLARILATKQSLRINVILKED